jgi:hypothetical protein
MVAGHKCLLYFNHMPLAPRALASRKYRIGSQAPKLDRVNAPSDRAMWLHSSPTRSICFQEVQADPQGDTEPRQQMWNFIFRSKMQEWETIQNGQKPCAPKQGVKGEGQRVRICYGLNRVCPNLACWSPQNVTLFGDRALTGWWS